MLSLSFVRTYFVYWLISIIALFGAGCYVKQRSEAAAILSSDAHWEAWGEARLQATVHVSEPVLFTVTNAAYVNFTRNWVFHARTANITNILVIAEDEASLRSLLADGVPTMSRSDFVQGGAGSTSQSLSLYGSGSFKQLSCHRATYLLRLLRSGVEAAYSDSDAVFFRSPWPLVADASSVLVGDIEDCAAPVPRHRVCTCFIAMRPSEDNIRIAKSWKDRCARHTDMDDQVGLAQARVSTFACLLQLSHFPAHRTTSTPF